LPRREGGRPKVKNLVVDDYFHCLVEHRDSHGRAMPSLGVTYRQGILRTESSHSLGMTYNGRDSHVVLRAPRSDMAGRCTLSFRGAFEKTRRGNLSSPFCHCEPSAARRGNLGCGRGTESTCPLCHAERKQNICARLFPRSLSCRDSHVVLRTPRSDRVGRCTLSFRGAFEKTRRGSLSSPLCHCEPSAARRGNLGCGRGTESTCPLCHVERKQNICARLFLLSCLPQPDSSLRCATFRMTLYKRDSHVACKARSSE